jgi:hypothetical protein
MNKISDLLRTSFLYSVLCAPENTLDLSSLWREPGLVLVRLDRAVLGEAASRLFAGMLVYHLFRTALATEGPVTVHLALDELPIIERLVGGSGADLIEIVTAARSRGLHLTVCGQHLSGISENLRSVLLANTGVQLFLRLSYADAKAVGGFLAAGEAPAAKRVVIQRDRLDTAQWRQPILDPWGRKLRLRLPEAGSSWRKHASGSAQLADLEAMARDLGIARLYVHSADGRGPVPIRRYLQGVPEHSYRFEGAPLELAVTFPKPKVAAIDRASEADLARGLTRRLQNLRAREALLRVAGRETCMVRIADVPMPECGDDEMRMYVGRSAAANAQPMAPEAIFRARRAGMARVTSGEVEDYKGGDVNDGSLF